MGIYTELPSTLKEVDVIVAGGKPETTTTPTTTTETAD